jgi:hypothetical protein
MESWPAYIEWLLDHQTRLRDAVTAAGGLPATNLLDVSSSPSLSDD